MSRPRRVTCDCGRSFVTASDRAECDDCAEYRAGSVASMLPRPESWKPPTEGCDLPRGGPWRPDGDEGGLA